MNTFSSFKRFLAPPVFADDEEKTRIANLLNLSLWSFVGVAIIMAVASLLLAGQFANVSAFLFSSGILAATGLGGQALMRRGQTRLASVILVLTLLGLVTYLLCTYDGVRSTALTGYVLVIIVAGLLLGGRSVMVFALVVQAVLIGIYSLVKTGLIQPVVTSTDIGDLIIVVIVTGLSALMLFFAANSLAAAIETARRNARAQVKANWALEANRLTLEARTRDLALAAEIGQHLGTRHNLDQLLSEAVELIRARFDLYYTQVYLTDAGGKALALQAGTGVVGAELRQRQHRLPVGFGSINGMAAYEAHPIIVADTATSPTFKPNPLLPHTRSELAVPLMAGEKVVGVLDLQSAQPNALTDDNLPAFEAVAGQLAVAIENAQLFAEAAAARAGVETRVRQQTRADWEAFLNAIDRPEHLGYRYDRDGVLPLQGILPPPDADTVTAPLVVAGEAIGQIRLQHTADHTWTEEDQELTFAVARQVALQIENLRLLAEAERYRAEAEQATRRLTHEGWTAQPAQTGFTYDQTQVQPLSATVEAPTADAWAATFTQALTVRGETIGELAFVQPTALDEAATQLVTTIAERLSTHLENLRLAAQTETALAETDILYRASQAIGQARTVPDILKGGTEVASFMGMTGMTLLVLAPHEAQEQALTVDIFAIQWAEGKWSSRPARLNTHQDVSSLLAALRTAPNQLLVYKNSGNLAEAISEASRAMLRQEGDQGLASAGLSARGELLGCLTFTSSQPLTEVPERYFQNLLRSLADQMAIAIDSQRLSEQTQKRAAELEAVARVSTVASTLLDAHKLLQAVVDLTKYAFFLYHTHIYLLNDTLDRLVLTAGAGEVGQHMVAQGWSIPLDRERSLVARTARERRGVIVNNVRAAPDFLPNPLLPETQSEMAVPIMVGDRLLGVFDVQADRVGRFTNSDLQIQTTLAAQVAVALQNANLFTQTQTTLAETEGLYLASAKLNVALTYDDILSVIHQFTVASEGTHIVSINLFDQPASESVRPQMIDVLAFWSALPPETTAQLPRHFRVADFPAFDTALRPDRPTVVEDFATTTVMSAAAQALFQKTLGAQSVIFVPLKVGDQWMGYINLLYPQPRQFSEASLRRLVVLAGQAAVAINSRQLFDTLQARARRERLLREITTRVRTSMDADTILRTAVRELGTALDREAFIRLGLANTPAAPTPNADGQPAAALQDA